MARDSMLWVEALGAGMKVGEKFGDRFTTWNLNRRADNLREKIEAEAKARNMDPEQLMDEYEPQLRDITAGARRRGMTDPYGKSLEEGIREGITSDWGRAAERRAGALQQEGKMAEAREERAQSLLARGEFDPGVAQQLQGQTIRDTTGAIRKEQRPKMGPDGKPMVDAQGQPVMEEVETYDPAKGAQSQALTAARFGDPGAAAQNQELNEGFVRKNLRLAGDRALAMVANPEMYSNDQIRGAFQAVKEWEPRLQHMDVQKNEETNEITLFTNGKATGTLEPEDIAQMTNAFSQDPGAAVAGHIQAQIKAKEAMSAQDVKVSDEYRTARLKLVDKLADAGLGDDAEKVVTAKSMFSGGADSNGIKMVNVSEPGSYIMEVDGKKYVLKTGIEGNLDEGEQGGMQWFKMDGETPVAAPKGASMSEQQQSALIDLSSTLAANKRKGAVAAINTAFKALDALEEQERPGRGPRFGGSSRTGPGEGFQLGDVDRDELHKRQMAAESAGDDKARSKKGAYGRMQLMPATAREMEKKLGMESGLTDRDPEANERAGKAYMDEQIKEFGDPVTALVAYNWGPDNARKWIKAGSDPSKLPEETRNYVNKIIGGEGAMGAVTTEPETQTVEAKAVGPVVKPAATIDPNRVANASPMGRRAAEHRAQRDRLNELKPAIAEAKKYINDLREEYGDQIEPVASSGRGDAPLMYRRPNTPEAQEYERAQQVLEKLEAERDKIAASVPGSVAGTQRAIRQQELAARRRAQLGPSAAVFDQLP